MQIKDWQEDYYDSDEPTFQKLSRGIKTIKKYKNDEPRVRDKNKNIKIQQRNKEKQHNQMIKEQD